MAGALGFEPRYAGTKNRCVNRFATPHPPLLLSGPHFNRSVRLGQDSKIIKSDDFLHPPVSGTNWVLILLFGDHQHERGRVFTMFEV